MTASVKLKLKLVKLKLIVTRIAKLHNSSFYLLIRDFLVVCIFVSELKDFLKALQVPGCENKPVTLYSQTSIKTTEDGSKPAHQLWTRRTDGVLSKLSGNKLISFMMLANLTGSSCLRKAKDVFSHAFSEPERWKIIEKNVTNILAATFTMKPKLLIKIFFVVFQKYLFYLVLLKFYI